MNMIKAETDAKEFVITLAFGSQKQAVARLDQNPALVNTLTMMNAIIPQLPLDSSKTSVFEMPLQIRKLLGECSERGILSKKKLWQIVNACSPKHGETMATLLLKLMISNAQVFAQTGMLDHADTRHLKQFHHFRKILNLLIQNNSTMKIDVNVPNARGQYPLQLLNMVKSQGLFRLLSRDYEHIAALTNPTIKKRLEKNKSAKCRIDTLDVSRLPKIRVKLTNNQRTDRCAISVLSLKEPAFLKSSEKSPFSIIPIYSEGTYLIMSFSKKHIEIASLRDMHNTKFSINFLGKWVELSSDSIYPTYQMLMKKNADYYSRKKVSIG